MPSSGKEQPAVVGVIDVGTNTVLYLLAGPDEDGVIRVLDEGLAATRLGDALTGDDALRETARARTVDAIREFAERARLRGASDVIAFGTDALRRAPWRDDFLSAVAEKAGVAVAVISAEEEGTLAMLAARYLLPLGTAPATVVDVGGGSVQIARETDGGKIEVNSYPLGCVTLTKKFGLGGEGGAWDEARACVRRELRSVAPASGKAAIMGGTATTVAVLLRRMEGWDPEAVHGVTVNRAEIDRLAENVFRLPLESRRGLRGMPADRADVFPAGALVLAEVLSALGKDEALVSAWGARFGAACRYFLTTSR